jgi:predicted DNA-binding transcriptional regulator AlpA
MIHMDQEPSTSPTAQESSIFLTVNEAAALLRLKRNTLDIWRTAGQGPPWSKAGGRVLYPRSALLAWVDEQAKSSTSEEPRRAGSRQSWYQDDGIDRQLGPPP